MALYDHPIIIITILLLPTSTAVHAVERGVERLAQSVGLFVLYTKRLKLFRPNFPYFNLATPSSPFILKVKRQG